MGESGTPRMDVDLIRAVLHPLRVRLYELLVVRGPATVGMLAEWSGAAVGQVSYHVRQLGRYGYAREDAALARDGREHWWRAVTGGFHWNPADLTGTAAEREVASAAIRLIYRQRAERLAGYLARKDDWPAEWQAAAWSTDTRFRLTPAELEEMVGEVTEVFNRWYRRGLPDPETAPPAGEPADDGREHVYLIGYAFPYRP